MKALFNENREILGVCDKIFDEENRSDWIEITGGDSVSIDEQLWACGQALYTVNENGIISKKQNAQEYIDREIKIKQLEFKHARKAALQALKANETLDQDETAFVDSEIAKIDAITGIKAK